MFSFNCVISFSTSYFWCCTFTPINSAFIQ